MCLLASCATQGTPQAEPTRTPTSVTPEASTTPAVATIDVRPPAVAGAFYPADPAQLQAMVNSLLSQARKLPQEPIALIVPHAGYVYSGAVAAAAFKQLEGREYDAIVVLGTNHVAPGFRQVSVWASGAYSTPLGLMPVDSDLAKSILSADPEHIVPDQRVQLAEHSIEVELPFLFQVCGPQPFVPIMVGEPSWENCEALSTALVEALQGKKALLIASTDMSHYPSYDHAVQVDMATLLAISSTDPQAVREHSRSWMSLGVDSLVCTLCGEGPVLTAMMAARKLGANRATVIQYANSGDVPYGDKSRVVGYGAVMFWRDETATLSAEEKATLLRMARETLSQYLQDGTMPQYEVSEPALLQPSAAFVTLKKNGQLRGCIGHMLGSQELYRTAQQMAISAAMKDSRFPAVTQDELAQIRIEISVLSPLQWVREVDEIEVGRDGLYIVLGPYSGVLLPQVATDQGWDRDDFLHQVCAKAGLPSDAWLRGGMLYRFTAQVFSEPN